MTPQPRPGTRLVEETMLLLEAVAEQVGPWLDRVAVPAAVDDQDTDDRGTPLGLLFALMRGQPNAQAARYLDRAADLMAVVRAVLADRWEPHVMHMPGFRRDERSTPGDSLRVQRIPLRPVFDSDT